MKKWLKILAAVAVVAVLAVLGMKAVKAKRAQEAALPPAKEYAVVVETMVPKTERVRLTLPYIAEVGSDNDTVVASRLAARVEMIHREGARVKAGEVVAKLDTTDLEAKMATLRSQIVAAKAAVEAKKVALKSLRAVHARTEKLLKVRGASPERYEEEASRIAAAEAGLKEAKAKVAGLRNQLEELRNQMRYAVLKAPVSGTIAKAYLHAGDMAMPGKPLLLIAAKAGDFLTLRLPSDMAPKGVLFRHKHYDLYPLRRSDDGLAAYRTKRLNLGLPRGEREDVRVVVFEGEAVRLPMDALLQSGGETRVFVLEKGKAHPRRVEILASGSEGVALSPKGLAGRELVVAKPDILLRVLGGVPVVVKR
ncbi:efflux RND transporter periplasmic adaptor subunit [Hydrogenimonas sp.]